MEGGALLGGSRPPLRVLEHMPGVAVVVYNEKRVIDERQLRCFENDHLDIQGLKHSLANQWSLSSLQSGPPLLLYCMCTCVCASVWMCACTCDMCVDVLLLTETQRWP